MRGRWSNETRRHRGRYSVRLVGSTGHHWTSHLQLQGNLGGSAWEFDHDHCQNIRMIHDITKGKDSQVQGSKCVPTSNFASDKEIGFPKPGSTFSNSGGPYCNGIEGNLSGLVDSNRIKVEGFQRQTGEVNQLVHDRRLPFSETILDGSEFGQLTIPIRVNTEGLHITILIEVRSLTTICLDGDDGAIILPK